MSTEIPKYTWSFSSLGLFECPKHYEVVRAKKLIPSQQSESGNEGARLHELIEAYLEKDIWSDELKKWKKVLDIYKAKNGVCEVEYGFKWQTLEQFLDSPVSTYLEKDGDRYLVRCEADDPDRWYLGYIDWMKIDGENCELVDWKTGKIKISKQLELYAWLVFTCHPQVMRVKATFHWLNFGDQTNDWFERKDKNRLFLSFKETLEQIDNCYRTDTWPEDPGIIGKNGRGAHCRFCPVTTEYCSQGVTL